MSLSQPEGIPLRPSAPGQNHAIGLLRLESDFHGPRTIGRVQRCRLGHVNPAVARQAQGPFVVASLDEHNVVHLALVVLAAEVTKAVPFHSRGIEVQPKPRCRIRLGFPTRRSAVGVSFQSGPPGLPHHGGRSTYSGTR